MSDLRPQEEKTHMHSCLVVQPIHEDGIRRLEEAGITARYASNADMATVAREIGEASAVITRDAGLTAEAIGRAARLAVIANHGIGTNKIDVAAAGLAGIPIVYTPHANARSVAEHALHLTLAVARRAMEADRAARSGHWAFRYDGGMQDISGKVMGLVGFGGIAKHVCAIARNGFSMQVIVWSPNAPEADIRAAGALPVARLEDLLAKADVVSLHRPLRDDTRHTIDACAIAAMKRTAILINTARGALVDEAALARSLLAGDIAGAGLDVFETEPLPKEHPLVGCERAVLAPHTAGSTEDALSRAALQCADQIIDVLAGRRPAHVLDAEVWSRRRMPSDG